MQGGRGFWAPGVNDIYGSSSTTEITRVADSWLVRVAYSYKEGTDNDDQPLARIILAKAVGGLTYNTPSLRLNRRKGRGRRAPAVLQCRRTIAFSTPGTAAGVAGFTADTTGWQ